MESSRILGSLFPLRWLLLAAVSLTSIACTPIARERTLPASVRAVYVPMIVNRSAEPGLEERVTVAMQEEFLADGRLRVVHWREADAIIWVTINEFRRVSRYFDVDDFATGQSYDVEAEIEILENSPGYPVIGGKRLVNSVIFYNADPRTTTFQPEPRVKDILYMELARMIVQEVITGEYVDDLDPDEPRPVRRQVRPAL